MKPCLTLNRTAIVHLMRNKGLKFFQLSHKIQKRGVS